MKNIKRIFVVLALSFVTLWGCEEAVSPLNEYYALTTVLVEKANIENAYIDDDKKFNERVAEIEKLIEDSSRVELKEEEDIAAQEELVKVAKNHLKSIKNLRDITLKSNKKQKKDDFSLVNKETKLLANNNKSDRELHSVYNKVSVSIPDNERTEKLGLYEIEFTDAQIKVSEVDDYKQKLIMKNTMPTSKDFKKMKTKVADARKTLADLAKVEVDEEDKDVKEYKEKALKNVIDNCEKVTKYVKSNNVYKSNQIIQQNNVYNDEAYRTIYYNVLVVPYLPKEEEK